MGIEWIVFDLGGVLVEVDFAATISTLSQKTGFPPHRVTELLLGSAENHRLSPAGRFSRGQISAAAYLEEMVRLLDHTVSPRELRDLRRREIADTIPAGVTLLKKLSRRFRLACFSNSNEIHWQVVLRQFSFFDHFAVRMASHLCGAVKPEAAAFTHICRTLSTPPETILLLDDRGENVIAAENAGLRAIRFDASASLSHKLQKHGIDLDETI